MGKRRRNSLQLTGQIIMSEQKAFRTIFIYSISIVVALVVVNIVFFTIVSFLGLFAKSEMMHYTAIIIAISLSAFCGFKCYKKISVYLKEELKKV
jgi:hypothetical protein